MEEWILETNVIIDSFSEALKDDNEEVLNTSLASVVVGINKGKSKWVMGYSTTERMSEGDMGIVAKRFIDKTSDF